MDDTAGLLVFFFCFFFVSFFLLLGEICLSRVNSQHGGVYGERQERNRKTPAAPDYRDCCTSKDLYFSRQLGTPTTPDKTNRVLGCVHVHCTGSTPIYLLQLEEPPPLIASLTPPKTLRATFKLAQD